MATQAFAAAGILAIVTFGAPATAQGPSFGQGSGVARPAPVETAPLPPSGVPQSQTRGRSTDSAPPGGVTLSQEAPGGASAPAAPSTPPAPAIRTTLVPTPGDPMDVAEVTLPGRPVALLSGQSSWDEGFDNLKNSFATIEAELGRAGLRPAGRPVTIFTETDDAGFRFEAMIPVDGVPAAPLALAPQISFGRTPEGRAFHFVHKGPYENIDSTYETITAYLDAKGIVAKDVFIEEYVSDLTDNADPSLEINIFVQPR